MLLLHWIRFIIIIIIVRICCVAKIEIVIDNKYLTRFVAADAIN